MTEVKFGKLGEHLAPGYHQATTQDSAMMMDIGLQVMKTGDVVEICQPENEVAVVILTGEVEVEWEGQKAVLQRTNLFNENPECLHVCKGVKIKMVAKKDSEVLIQATANEKTFPSKLYKQEDVVCDVFGGGVWQGTATRTVRTIFDYESAPYSNMVNGEVINSPGRWSSYIPHHHPQPEVYLYKFDRPQGFGAAFVGKDVFRSETNAFVAISGGNEHPQVTAPGYAMWYSWMIRHLSNDPWAKTRIVCEEHAWLEEPGADEKIWQPNLKK